MQPIGNASKNLTDSPRCLETSAKDTSARKKLATYHAGLILSSYRTGDANDPEVYTAAISHVLSRYPADIGARLTDPKDGIAGRFKWLPSVMEVREECDRLAAADARVLKRKSELEEQFRLRDEHESAPRPTQSYEDFKAEMAMRGMPIDHASRTYETPESVKAKYGISDAEWDAIKDLPRRVTDKNVERLR